MLLKVILIVIGVVTDTLKGDIAAHKAMIEGLKKMRLSLGENIEEMTHLDAPVLVIVNLTTHPEVTTKLMKGKTIVISPKVLKELIITAGQEEIVIAHVILDLSVMETILKMAFLCLAYQNL